MNTSAKIAKQAVLDRIIKIQKELKEIELRLGLVLHRIDNRWVNGDNHLDEETDRDLVTLDYLVSSAVLKASSLVEM